MTERHPGRETDREGERDRPEIDIDDFSKQHRHIRERRRGAGPFVKGRGGRGYQNFYFGLCISIRN